MGGLLDQLRDSVRNRDYELTLHARRRINLRRISVREIEDAVLNVEAEVIEDYPDDPRGASCLILGFASDTRPIHVQLTYPTSVAVITAYEPDPEQWTDFKTRRHEQV